MRCWERQPQTNSLGLKFLLNLVHNSTWSKGRKGEPSRWEASQRAQTLLSTDSLPHCPCHPLRPWGLATQRLSLHNHVPRPPGQHLSPSRQFFDLLERRWKEHFLALRSTSALLRHFFLLSVTYTIRFLAAKGRKKESGGGGKVRNQSTGAQAQQCHHETLSQGWGSSYEADPPAHLSASLLTPLQRGTAICQHRKGTGEPWRDMGQSGKGCKSGDRHQTAQCLTLPAIQPAEVMLSQGQGCWLFPGGGHSGSLLPTNSVWRADLGLALRPRDLTLWKSPFSRGGN